MVRIKSVVLLFCLMIISPVFSQDKGTEAQRKSLQAKVDQFQQFANNKLTEPASTADFDVYFMSDEDLNYWMGQFKFTKETQQEISKEEFYNKIESWAIEAKTNLVAALRLADKIEIIKIDLQFKQDPTMRVNKSANLTISLHNDAGVIKLMQLTFIEVRGNLKLIQAY